MKRQLKLGLAATSALALLLTGCSSSSSTGTASGSASASTASKLSVVSVINGTLGDASFFDSAETGMTKLKAEGHKTQTIQTDANNQTSWKQNTEAVSGKWDIVVVGTSQMVDILKEIAPKFPNQKYVIYDDVVAAPNVASITFKQNEGSYLAGVLAALATTNKDKFPKASGSKVVGLVGGMDIPIINDFVAGFKKGVETVDPTVQVKVGYVGNFTDSDKGYSIAKSMYEQDKADVVFQVAGGAGNGVLKAAKDTGRYAIGVDSNQNKLYQGNILASMLKNVGDGIHTAVTAADAGTLAYGKTTAYGLKNNGVGLTFADNGDIVPADVQAKIKDFAAQVSDGKITVPTTLS
ncbi:MAG: BMP family lipoprotein [Propionibacteriaceae bacterium]